MNRLAVWILGWLAILVLVVFTARAHSPEDTDPAMAPWFRSLEIPGTEGASCCSEHDCVTVNAADLKVDADGYWVRDPEGQGFLQVPADRILQRWDNPTGKFVVCALNHRVLCFVKAAGI